MSSRVDARTVLPTTNQPEDATECWERIRKTDPNYSCDALLTDYDKLMQGLQKRRTGLDAEKLVGELFSTLTRGEQRTASTSLCLAL